MAARALVIDDSRAIRTVLKRVLTQLGFDAVDEAEHGREGLERLATHPDIELVLVDWNMPVMDGLSFVHAVRDERRRADLKVVMVSTESRVENVQLALDAGVDEYVMKPFTPTALAEKLELLGIAGHP